MGSIFSSSSKEYVHSKANQWIFQPHQTAGFVYPPHIRQFNIKSKNGNLIEIICCVPQKMKRLTNKLIIFSHGNASINEDMYSYLQWLSNMLLIEVVCYDYQGYGNSQGQPGEQNCYDDIESVVKYFINQENHKREEIYLMGQSLGTGVTADFISKHNWNNPVILISPYESILRIVASESIAYVSSSVDMFDTQGKMIDIQCPVKIYHGKNDDMISVNHSINLFNALPNKTLLPTFFDNCGHNDILYRIDMNELLSIIY